MRKKQLISGIMSFIAAALVLVTLLIISLNLLCLDSTAWYRHEYVKYEVLEDVRGQMSMDDALEVTHQMQLYLRGKRADLNVEILIDGERREFFTEREKEHLSDCRQIFKVLGWAKWITLAAALALLAAVHRIDDKGMAGKYALSTSGIVLVSGAILALSKGGFAELFERMHLALFSNDLWLLDPHYDNLINLLPLGFFNDTATAIAAMTVVGAVLTALLLAEK